MHQTMKSLAPASDAKPNWLHLDLKGIIPSFEKLLSWLDFFADAGFNGIVWEYEDRYDWQAFPGVARQPYTSAQWQAIWDHCRKLNLEVTPLIQTHGHLEWLLKHEAYATWREAGFFNEICPQNRKAVEQIAQWLDEVIDLHPDSRYIHIGADETWNLCSCDACKEVAAAHPDGKMSIYMKQAIAMCEQVLARGKQPMIWADMFWRENRMDLADKLPRGVILIDWQYAGKAPYPTTERLSQTGLELWGASAIRRSHDTTFMQPGIEGQIDNVLSWNQQLAKGKIAGVIHTLWGRSRSLLPLYGPWEGWIPGFIAAGGRTPWQEHPLSLAVRVHEQFMVNLMPTHPGKESQALKLLAKQAESMDAFSQQCLRWWALAAEQLQLRSWVQMVSLTDYTLRHTNKHVTITPEGIAERCRVHADVDSKLEALAQQVRQFFADNQLSDVDEYIDERITNLRDLLAGAGALGHLKLQTV